jgi:hypothetical protein
VPVSPDCRILVPITGIMRDSCTVSDIERLKRVEDEVEEVATRLHEGCVFRPAHWS